MFKKTILVFILIIIFFAIFLLNTKDDNINLNTGSEKSNSYIKKSIQQKNNNEIKNIDSFGKEVHREKNGKSYHIFFKTSYKNRDTLNMIVDYYKKKNTSFTFRILFFNKIPLGVKLGYPMSQKLAASWTAEYILNTRNGTDSLYYIEH